MQPYDCGQDAESEYFPGSACISSSINLILMCAKKKEQMERGQKEKKRKEKAEHRKSTKDFIGDVEKEKKKKMTDIESAKKADP